MSLLERANEECQKLRRLKNPYTVPETFPDPPIQSNQMLGSLIAIQEEFNNIKKRLLKLEKKLIKNKTVRIK